MQPSIEHVAKQTKEKLRETIATLYMTKNIYLDFANVTLAVGTFEESPLPDEMDFNAC